jgi:Ras-related GTP-binding protein C/D
MIFGGCGDLVFVIDDKDEYMEELNKMKLKVKKDLKVKNGIRFEVFIKKVDGM